MMFHDFSIEHLLDQTKPIFAYDLFCLILSWWLSKAFAKRKGTHLDVTPTKTDTTLEKHTFELKMYLLLLL